MRRIVSDAYWSKLIGTPDARSCEPSARFQASGNAMQVEQHTARRHLNRLVELGLVRRTGRTRGTTYDVL